MTAEAAVLQTPPRAALATPSAAFARVAVFRESAPVLDAWAELEQSVPCSIYQTRAWLLPWIETLGRKAGIAPLFVLAYGADDRPVALLPLGLQRRGRLRIAVWLGGSDSNLNMPLVRASGAWSAAETARLLRQAAAACGPDRPDLFNLVNQPFDWDGKPNPLARLAHRPSPSAAYGTTLPTDAETLFASKLSKDSRKKLRKKEARLAALGPLSHLVVTDSAAQKIVLDRFIAQKVERFRAQGIVSEFDSPEMRAFIEAASAPNGTGIELHALLAGERPVAIYGGAAHGGQWSGMFNSFDTDEEIAKSSPGDLLMMRIIANACAQGQTGFDLGVGEARYKAALCDERIALFDAIVPVTMLGRAAASLVASRQAIKRTIKSNPRLFALAKAIRARLA